jgi:hypothetical protein
VPQRPPQNGQLVLFVAHLQDRLLLLCFGLEGLDQSEV